MPYESEQVNKILGAGKSSAVKAKNLEQLIEESFRHLGKIGGKQIAHLESEEVWIFDESRPIAFSELKTTDADAAVGKPVSERASPP